MGALIADNPTRSGGRLQMTWKFEYIKKARNDYSLPTWKQGRAYWVIEDKGPGVPEAEREAIFSISGKSKGPGQQMGLSLLRASLREQGADI